MDNFMSIILIVILFFACFAAGLIIQIRNKKSALGGPEEKDIIDVVSEKKKKKLMAKHSSLSFKTYVLLITLVPIAIGVAGWFLIENKLIVLILALVSAFIPDAIINVMRAKKAAKFEEQYARALKLFANCLRSKMTIQQSVNDICISPYIDESVKVGFRQINADLSIGIDVKDAFNKFAEDAESEDARDVASAIAMQDEVGGGEAEIIETLANSIQQRIMMRKEIKTLFTETSVMVTFMDFAPFIVLIIMYFGAPDFVAPYFESTGMMLVLIGMLAFSVAGSFVIRMIINSAKKGGKAQ